MALYFVYLISPALLLYKGLCMPFLLSGVYSGNKSVDNQQPWLESLLRGVFIHFDLLK